MQTGISSETVQLKSKIHCTKQEYFSFSGMADATHTSLSGLLGLKLCDVDILEERIQRIKKPKNTEHDDYDDDYIEIKLMKFIDPNYDSLKSIDRTKRITFLRELKEQLGTLPERYQTTEVQKQMALISKICYFDFAQKPLSSVFEGVHNMDTLAGCEEQLLQLIDKLRNQYNLKDVLNGQYESIRTQRCKMVLVVAGSLKAGKSSFINYLLESTVCPVGICATTARLTKITYGQQKLVKLESATGELKEQYEIHNDEQLKEITKKLIALKGDAREKVLCQDIVVIQLDRKELEYVELWDIPGYDENEFLNSVVEDILSKTDIFFILTSITEAVHKTTVDLLRSCSEKHKRQPQACFVVTKIDQVTTNPNAETTLAETLKKIFHQIENRFQMKLGHEWESAMFFIPLCTDWKYSLNDFLDSHKQFTLKLSRFFKDAVHHNTLCRLDYLIDTIHELLDYDDLNRSIQRDEKLFKILTVYRNELRTQLQEELKQPFIRIHKNIAKSIADVMKSGDASVLQQVLADAIQKELLVNRKKLEETVSTCLDTLYSKLEKNLQLSAVIRSLEKRRIYGNPYQAVVGQYRNAVDSLMESAKFYHTASSLRSLDRRGIDVSKNVVPVGDQTTSRKYLASTLMAFFRNVYTLSTTPIEDYECFDIVWRAVTHAQLTNMARKSAQSSTETILNGLLQDILNHIYQMLCEQLNSISDDIRRRREELCGQQNTAEVETIAEFLKNNNSSVVQLYLNLLDKTNQFEYPHRKINTTKVLGKSNFPVFAGILSDDDEQNSVKIAAKLIPLNSFIWQEVRYMNELKHENILHYYGVCKTERLIDHYYILMQRLDANLVKYINYASRKGKVNDKLMDEIFRQITNGIMYLHEQGLIHRDIKPENVLVQFRKVQPPIFIIADFGFVHRVPISIKGTPDFLAPELYVHNTNNTFITAKVDIFALGVTIQQTVDESLVSKQGKYVKFWTEISQSCRSDDPFERPTCKQILEKRNKLTE